MNMKNPITTLAYDTFSPNIEREETLNIAQHLESGGVLFLPNLAFTLNPSETRFLSTEWSDGKSKNIYLRGNERALRGAIGGEKDLNEIKLMIERYANGATQLISSLLPAYMPYATPANTSLRCFEAAGRKSSWRKDDRRLHPDAFPSKPTHGERILRVFTNINAENKPRTWKVGEPFADMAEKFLPKLPNYRAWQASILNQLRVTKTLRGEYDHIMLHLHDKVKADLEYQRNAPQLTVDFPAGSTWIVYSDQVLHAVLAGRCMMEQTFHIPQKNLYSPDSSPLKQLEKLMNRSLII
jgi:hypothetical protein